MRWFVISNGKSGKREVAIFVLAGALLLVLWSLAFVEKIDFPTYKDFVLHIFDAALLFAAGAFGIDAAIKGGMLGGGQPAPRVPLGERPHNRAADLPRAPAD